MLPLLQFASDGHEHASSEPLQFLVQRFDLSEEDQQQILPSGGNRLYDRMHWALSYLRQAQLLEMTRRGYFKLTQRGRDVLSTNPTRVDTKSLKQFPEFQEFLQRKGRGNGSVKPSQQTLSSRDLPQDQTSLETVLTQTQTPKETLEESYLALRHQLASDLLGRVKACSPQFFEQLVVDLLVKMGYGGSRQDAGAAIGRSGDEGIDGIIKEDRLGLDVIYIQAKRWERSVGRPEIHQFVGALHGQRARKGIFITTSQFTRDALEYVRTVEMKIVLIDGEHLTDFMIDHDVGVAVVSTYQLKRIDFDYFTDE